ncbi:MAG: TetR family transcriptional regulator [Pseudomonadota bacterium]|uniref:TetR/AcrR family transcriptional regulator n=1 Tax=Thalassovita sp. TaxID=1979401 RepID=UPI002AAF0D1A|nr:TetR family transcriptional regulator [Thalassovita sp.]MEC8039206.1 TetR family transcriptional regulator [Pseudomonadota bacterium]
MTQAKKRDAAATQQRILEAAQRVFHEEGYDGATTREIARRAEVNIALITRYFGSKIGLFEKAVIPFLHIGWLVENGVEGVPERLVDTYMDTPPWRGFDPMIVFLRSASSVEAGPLLEEAMNRQIVAPLMGALEGPDARARAVLLATQIGGLIVFFRILDQKTQSPEEADAMRGYLMTYFRDLLNGKTAP